MSIRLEDILLLGCFGGVVWELEFVWIKSREIEVPSKDVIVVVGKDAEIGVARVCRSKSYQDSFPINAPY